jgi:hypothetical protein
VQVPAASGLLHPCPRLPRPSRGLLSFLMLLTEYLDRNGKPTEDEEEEVLRRVEELFEDARRAS